MGGWGRRAKGKIIIYVHPSSPDKWQISLYSDCFFIFLHVYALCNIYISFNAPLQLHQFPFCDERLSGNFMNNSLDNQDYYSMRNANKSDFLQIFYQKIIPK